MNDLIIPKSQTKVSKNVVTVSSPELIEKLIKNNEESLNAFKSVNVTVDEISISKTGKLQIANKSFAEVIKQELAPARNVRCLLIAKCLPNPKLCIPLAQACLSNSKGCGMPGIPVPGKINYLIKKQ